MDIQISANKFEKIVADLFKLLGYSVEVNHRFKGREIDIIATQGTKTFVDIKFYRSKKVPNSLVRQAANNFAYLLKTFEERKGILVVNSYVPDLLKEEIRQALNIEIWDRAVVMNHSSNLSVDLMERYEQLLLETQQGTDTSDASPGYEELEAATKKEHDPHPNVKPTQPTPPVNPGQAYKNKLDAMHCGRAAWSAYERLILDILKFLFDNDLTLWEKQARTDDGLSRFDLICRINSKDDYWLALINSFNSRFVLFECKNYCDKITQDQIFTTERYLFLKALRSVGFMISRKGGNAGAITAAKGALKENGKLILILSDDDLKKMLDLKDQNLNPNDYLSDMLDKWLIELSR